MSKGFAVCEEFVEGRHGVIVSDRNGRVGVLLPLAWQTYATIPKFLSEACRKANLPLDAWRMSHEEAVSIHSFEAQIFCD